jgi:hypothetical protein
MLLSSGRGPHGESGLVSATSLESHRPRPLNPFSKRPLSNPVVLDSGVISPPGLDVYYGSIAVNPLGEVVIGFSGSGPNDYPSAYAVTGTLNGDALQLGAPMPLKAGVAPDITGRFGDYSTTTYDPNDPSHFWTIQEWTSGPSHWSTEITEITFGTATATQTWFGGTGNFSDPQNWSPPGSPASTDTLIINAGKVRAIGQTLTNPNIDLGSSSSTPTLVLKDTKLASATHIRVETPPSTCRSPTSRQGSAWWGR